MTLCQAYYDLLMDRKGTEGKPRFQLHLDGVWPSSWRVELKHFKVIFSLWSKQCIFQVKYKCWLRCGYCADFELKVWNWHRYWVICNMPSWASLVAWVVKNLPANTGDLCSISGSGRSPGEWNGNALQYSCLGHPKGRGAWWATVHGVEKSLIWLSD